ncbi:MAG: DNA mismatch repair protein MutS [Treponema sp.]|jgi:DNA mismatch repair protein MutS|nr:DNA mismatch repair protein MutS [Treponema sp.]
MKTKEQFAESVSKKQIVTPLPGIMQKAENTAVSPLMEQYRSIKKLHQGNVLFFRLGDFYEMFADDAIEVSALLNLTLTSRNGLPMCGIPYHASRSYVARLLRMGKKIAVCEQLSEPGKGRGIVERRVVEVITPGTTIDEDYLDQGSSNYLSCLASSSSFVSFAYIDVSTGDFYAASFPFKGAAERLKLELERLQIRELIVQESLLEENSPIAQAILNRPNLVLNRWADWLFDREKSAQRLQRQFNVVNLKGFGIEDKAPEVIAAGALLDYLDETAHSLIPHVRSIKIYSEDEFAGMDEATQRNLELIRNLQNGDKRFTLLEVIDETKTGMGTRLLKRRILFPLRNMARINHRLDMVECLYHDQAKQNRIREVLGKTPDLERLCSRLAMDKAHGKDMLAIKNALASFQRLKESCDGPAFSFESPEAAALDDAGMNRLSEIQELIEQALLEDPSILLTEGKLIKSGYNAELDKLIQLRDEGRKMLEAYLEEERQKTGISSLKIHYNRLIGYFFEVTKAHLAKIPPYFIRRQNIVAGERFTTDRLAGLESDINGASDRVIELERKLFLDIRSRVKEGLREIYAAAVRIAEIDVAQSFARAATVQDWVRPEMNMDNRVHIIEGRHPVVEAHLPRGEFIPNDTTLYGDSAPFALITGPNMAGKSTYLRQTALIVIMAQAGSFVPARKAEIGIADRIYCRVGASDNLARGESTFLVEMNETAYILHTATGQSLVIMDEVGRGTGTKDGLSIAWAVSEELLDNIRCRTLFATHYHELSLISHPRLTNFSMEVLNRNGEIVFLRKLQKGSAAESYGLHVARLAGIPEQVLSRAARIMDNLKESEKIFNSALILSSKKESLSIPADDSEKSFSLKENSAVSDTVESASVCNDTVQSLADPLPPQFPDDTNALSRQMAEDLTTLDPDAITPLEALTLIHRWKLIANGKQPPRLEAPKQGKTRHTAVKTTDPALKIPSLFDFEVK